MTLGGDMRPFVLASSEADGVIPGYEQWATLLNFFKMLHYNFLLVVLTIISWEKLLQNLRQPNKQLYKVFHNKHINTQ